jgi:DNA adenine methylase
MLKPITKYQGGKARELPLIKQLLPASFTRVVEPFCGGAAVTFCLGCPSFLNDTNKDLINLYSVVADYELYSNLQQEVNDLKTLEHDTLEKRYYEARVVINQSHNNADKLQRALSYIIVKQLCFSGMERYNSNGEFNVPFGHYKKFSCNLSPNHHKFLKDNCIINCGSFDEVFSQVNNTDFVFLDPPYLERLGYTEGDGGSGLHEQLLSCLKTTSANWMLIHSDHDFYRDNYKDFNVIEKPFSYAQRFGKNKNHDGAKVQHLYITNYDCAMPLVTL